MKQLIWDIFLLFFLIGCAPQTVVATPTPTEVPFVYATPVNSLSEIPIFVGAMTFNELNNSGFTRQHTVSWESDDLQVTTDGKVSGTFQVENGGPKAPYALFKDILFFQVQGKYVWPHYGDILYQPLSNVIPLIAEVSDEHSARFRVDATFQIPPLVNDIDRGMPLRNLDIALTWVRVYKFEQSFYFQVFAGVSDGSPSRPEIRFDQEPQIITARFHYYSVLPKNAIQGGRVGEPQGEFEYYAWLQENIMR